MKRTPRIAAIHDLSGFGRCSLTIVMPVLSAMGLQCCPLPTAYLSTHTGGFTGNTFLDMTGEMAAAAAHWAALDIDFRGIYSGFMGSEASIYVYAEGSADYAVNFAQLTQRAGNFLVARESDPDFEWTDLKGKSVLGGRAGGMPQMVFEYILKKNGIDPEKDLDIDQSIDFGLTAAAFMEGDADYTVEFEPFATSIELEGEGAVVASLGVDSGYVPYTAYSANKSYFDEHPEIIQGFTNAIQRGLEYVNSHTAEEIAQVIAPQFPETDADTIAVIVGRYLEQDTWKEDLIFEKESFELLQDILEEAGELEERVPYEKLVTTDYAKKAASN